MVLKIDGILRQSHVDAYPCPVRRDQNPESIRELPEVPRLCGLYVFCIMYSCGGSLSATLELIGKSLGIVPMEPFPHLSYS